MGCGASSKPQSASIPTYGSETLPTIPISHSYDDKSPTDLESDVKTLLKETSILTAENERLKHDMSRDMAARFPATFTSTESLDELVGEWLALDLYEGDKEVDFLEVLYPPAHSAVAAVREYSAANRSRETSLTEYMAYFKLRYEETDKILCEMGQEKKDVDACVLTAKSKVVAAIKRLEPLLGKKSSEIDHLTELFAALQSKPLGVEFLSGLQHFYEESLACQSAHYEAKVHAAGELLAATKAEHAKAMSTLQERHREELESKTGTFERHMKVWQNSLWKMTDELAALRKAHRQDLDNHLLHFDIHCKRLQSAFTLEKQRLQSELEAVISDLRCQIAVFESHMVVKSAAEARCLDLESVIRGQQETIGDLQSHISDAHIDIESRDARIQELSESIVREAELQRMSKKQACTIRFMSRYSVRLRLEKTAVMTAWNTIAMQELLTGSGLAAPKPPYPLNIDEAMNEDGYPSEDENFADNLLRSRNQAIIHSSELSEMYAITAQKDKAMSTQQVIRIFEEMMERKFESDMSDLRNDRLPKSIPMFLYDHLFRSVGLKPLAIKALNQFMPGLQQLYTDGDPYGLLICRLLQMFHEDPVNYLMGLYLTEILTQFGPLVEKFVKAKADKNAKKGLKQAGLTSPRAKKMQSESTLGGSAFLRDVVLLVCSHFENERSIGERLMKLLQPEDLSLEDYISFLICQKMMKLNKTPDVLFRAVDADNAGAVTEGDFVMRLKEVLDLWVPEVSLRMLFRNVCGREKRMSQSLFLSRLSLSAYSSNSTSEQYAVSTIHFLLSLIQVFKDRERRFVLTCTRMLQEQGVKQITVADFDSLMQILDPMLSSTEVSDLWTIAIRESPSNLVLTPEQFITTILTHPVGALRDSVFCTSYSDNKDVSRLLLSAATANQNNSANESLATDTSSRTIRAKSAFT